MFLFLFHYLISLKGLNSFQDSCLRTYLHTLKSALNYDFNIEDSTVPLHNRYCCLTNKFLLKCLYLSSSPIIDHFSSVNEKQRRVRRFAPFLSRMIQSRFLIFIYVCKTDKISLYTTLYNTLTVLPFIIVNSIFLNYAISQ